MSWQAVFEYPNALGMAHKGMQPVICAAQALVSIIPVFLLVSVLLFTSRFCLSPAVFCALCWSSHCWLVHSHHVFRAGGLRAVSRSSGCCLVAPKSWKQEFISSVV